MRGRRRGPTARPIDPRVKQAGVLESATSSPGSTATIRGCPGAPGPAVFGAGRPRVFLTSLLLRTLGRVDDWRGGGRRKGGSRSRRLSPVAGASIPAMAPFPVAAHRTGHANFPHPALGRDHAFAHGRLAVRDPRCVSPYSVHSRSSGKRTHFPDRTFCLRQSHWRSRRVACRSIAA